MNARKRAAARRAIHHAVEVEVAPLRAAVADTAKELYALPKAGDFDAFCARGRRAQHFAMMVIMADHVDATPSVRYDLQRRALLALVANVAPATGRSS